MRKIVLAVHRYLGLMLGLFLLVSGVTGSAIVFSREFDSALNPALLHVSEQPLRASIDDVMTNIKRLSPERVLTSVHLPRSPNDAVEVLIKDSALRIYANPYTGEVLGTRQANRSLTGFLIDLHVHLLAGKTGEQVQGWAGVGAIVLCILGAWLWWPRPGHWKRAFSIKGRASAFRFWFDIHRVVGACTLAFLLVTTATGAALALYNSVTEPALVILTGQGTRQTAPKSATKVGSHVSLDSLLKQATLLFPSAQITRLTLPVTAHGAVGIRMRLPGEIHQFGRTFVWFNQYDGSLLRVDNALTAHLSVRIQSWLFPLHTGVYGGLLTQWMQVLVGLSLSLLTLSGPWLWFKKTNAKARSITLHASRQSA